tara:strand:+ start:100 stop:1248 length:1149 start_codon:yes stop_codon:yes gene_type:complete
MIKSKKKICIITSSRAEFGLLSRLIKKIQKNSSVYLIVTGSHISKAFGNTISEIKKEKIKIFKKIKISLNDDSEKGISSAISETITKFENIFQNLKPDLLLVLGDRYEIFSAVIAASIHRITIGHIHGGETTINSLDNYFRHSISIMSHLHFVAHKKYKNRVINLGKNSKNIFVVGGMGAANLQKISFNKKNKSNYYVCIFHPETLKKDYGIKMMKTTINFFSKNKKEKFIFFRPNADTKNKAILNLIQNSVKKCKNFQYINSINYNSFIKLIANSKGILGNSSCGILEAPSLKIPTINIGFRQKGRLKSKSIVDCKGDTKSLEKAFKKINSPEFKNTLKKTINPYYYGDSSQKIFNILSNDKTYKDISLVKFFNTNIDNTS